MTNIQNTRTDSAIDITNKKADNLYANAESALFGPAAEMPEHVRKFKTS